FDAGINLLKTVPYATVANYGFSVVPLFILMGNFCFNAGVSKDLYHTVRSWLGQLRGGLAMATVGACAGFAAVSGSSLATAATMGTVALPEMKEYKYDPALATGAISAGGTLGILIPPSVVLVIYGILTEQSIDRGPFYCRVPTRHPRGHLLYYDYIHSVQEKPFAGPCRPEDDPWREADLPKGHVDDVGIVPPGHWGHLCGHFQPHRSGRRWGKRSPFPFPLEEKDDMERIQYFPHGDPQDSGNDLHHSYQCYGVWLLSCSNAPSL
ncbi:MAG: TRAP transporter large permease subunit, partial [Deltaproteobacteria bacterium]|nr:TRAP transporter large permease subunit [Deltaproteobacteria bacterium]